MLQQTPDGVPLELSGELLFEDGTSAALFCSFLVHETQLAVVSGEKASVQVGGTLSGDRPVGLKNVLKRTVPSFHHQHKQIRSSRCMTLSSRARGCTRPSR